MVVNTKMKEIRTLGENKEAIYEDFNSELQQQPKIHGSSQSLLNI